MELVDGVSFDEYVGARTACRDARIDRGDTRPSSGARACCATRR